MFDLNQAIQLIRQGRKTEAQRLLQGILKSDPRNIQAWFWYVETCSTVEQRIQTLQACLKMNPGNPQALQALQILQQQQPATPPAPVVQSPPPVQPQPFQSSSEFRAEPHTIEKNQAVYDYEAFSPDDFTSTPAVPPVKEKAAWEMEPAKYEDDSLLSKSKKQKQVRSLSAFDVWMTALTVQDEKAFAGLLDDPEMGLGRAFGWIAVASAITALMVPVVLALNPEFQDLLSTPELRGSAIASNPTAFVVVITVAAILLTPIGAVFNLAITGGIQHLLARAFGGGGTYTRTVYAMAAYAAPMTVLISLASIIPYIGQCITFPLSIYSLVLNVRALKASQYLTTGAAVGVILAPSILAAIFVCLIVFSLAGSLPAS